MSTALNRRVTRLEKELGKGLCPACRRAIDRAIAAYARERDLSVEEMLAEADRILSESGKDGRT